MGVTIFKNTVTPKVREIIAYLGGAGTLGTPGTLETLGAPGTLGTPGTPGTLGAPGIPGAPGAVGAPGEGTSKPHSGQHVSVGEQVAPHSGQVISALAVGGLKHIIILLS